MTAEQPGAGLTLKELMPAHLSFTERATPIRNLLCGPCISFAFADLSYKPHWADLVPQLC
jgi:hypothetical protein